MKTSISLTIPNIDRRSANVTRQDADEPVETHVEHWPQGTIKRILIEQCGKWQSVTPDLPAERTFTPKGDLVSVRHCDRGLLHSPTPSIPAFQSYTNGILTKEAFYLHGKLHSPTPEKPAEKYFNSSGELIKVIFAQHGKLNSPSRELAAIQEFKNNELTYQEHYSNGEPQEYKLIAKEGIIFSAFIIIVTLIVVFTTR